LGRNRELINIFLCCFKLLRGIKIHNLGRKYPSNRQIDSIVP